jgi:hypothetical protein
MKNAALAAMACLALVGCNEKDADVASRNLSTAADNFEINRRIVFYNTINGEYLLVIEGLCSLGNNDTPGRMSVTCKVGPSAYKKHHMGTNSNVTFVSEQLDAQPASVYRYRVTFKPSVLLPSIDVR